MTRVLVTAAALPTGRNSVRALLQCEDIELFATDSREQALARLPFDIPKVKLPPPEDPNFVEMISKFCQENNIEVVLPCTESIASVLSKHKALLAERGISVPIPDYDVLLRGIDKSRLIEVSRSAGVPHPKSICLHSDEEIEKINSLEFPIIAKPTIGHGARGVLIYDHPPKDWGTLRKALRKSAMVVQEYIPGGTGSIYICGLLFDQAHNIKLGFQSKSTKTEFNFGGPALGGVSVYEPVIRSYAEAVVRAAGPWVGIALLEFKRHSDSGDFYIMDFNARIWGYSSLAEDAGLSFPFGSVLVAENKQFRTHEDYLVGVQMERHALFDESNFTCSCGKRVDLSGHRSHRANRQRVLAVLPDECNVTAVLSAISDTEIDAVLILGGFSESFTRATGQEKLYFWSPPVEIAEQDLLYWAGHLLQATEVRAINGENVQTFSWQQLRRSWWFGAG
jgi:ATP-grasp domain